MVIKEWFMNLFFILNIPSSLCSRVLLLVLVTGKGSNSDKFHNVWLWNKLNSILNKKSIKKSVNPHNRLSIISTINQITSTIEKGTIRRLLKKKKLADVKTEKGISLHAQQAVLNICLHFAKGVSEVVNFLLQRSCLDLLHYQGSSFLVSYCCMVTRWLSTWMLLHQVTRYPGHILECRFNYNIRK